MTDTSHRHAAIDPASQPTPSDDGGGRGAGIADPSPAVVEDIVTIEYEALLLGKRLARVAGFRNPHIGVLDRSAYILLVSLEDHPMSIGELSEVTGLDASTLNRQTAAMRHEGMIERIPDPDGGLARKFTITDEGKQSLALQRRRNLGALSTVLSDWNPEEISRFAAALAKFNRAVQRIEIPESR